MKNFTEAYHHQVGEGQGMHALYLELCGYQMEILQSYRNLEKLGELVKKDYSLNTMKRGGKIWFEAEKLGVNAGVMKLVEGKQCLAHFISKVSLLNYTQEQIVREATEIIEMTRA